MSGSATFTTVTSSSSMKVVIETASRVHHLCPLGGCTLRAAYARRDSGSGAPRAAMGSTGELAELLAHAVVEVGALELGELRDAVAEADLDLLADRQPAPVEAVEG